MKKLSVFLFTLLFCGAALNLQAKEEITDKGSGEIFDRAATFSADGKNYDLQATGSALRRKFVVKVYAVTHYFQDGITFTGDKFEQIINEDKAKQFTFKWLRGATVDQVQSGYLESFKAALSDADRQALDKDIKDFVGFYNQPVQKGDVHHVRWIPGGTIEVEVNGNKVGTIKNPTFAKALWSIWFGPKSVVNRDDLIALIK